MKNIENIDELIEQTLTEEEAKFYHKLDEQDFFEMFTGLYQGKLKWLTILTTIVMLFIFIAGVYCAIEFFNATTTIEMLKWGAGMFTSLIAISMLKLFNWLQIYFNKISREIKRIEFQISILSSKNL